MQIVIEISDYDKEWVTNGYFIPNEINGRIAEAIINGTLLPRHHGRLIDADKLVRPEIRPFLYHLKNGDTAIPEIDILHAPTIIEADKAESGK